MKRKIVINESSQLAYIADDIIKEGYKGDVEALMNFNTITLLRPGSSLEDQIESLELIISDLRLRKRARDNDGGNTESIQKNENSEPVST